MNKPNSLPNILTVDKIRKIINLITNLKHRAIISTIYFCGLRISEAVNLKINDIDSSAMTVKILNAKGRNDRIVMLSEKLLSLLREYFKEYKPKVYLFEGQKGEKYSSRSIQQIFNNAVKKVGGKRKLQYIHCVIVLHLTYLTMEQTFGLFRNCFDINICLQLKLILTSILYQSKK